MMKSKFMAGFVATIISLILVIAGAIFIVEVIQPENEDRLIKIVAFGVIGIWVAIYSWLKPKVKVENPNQNSSTSESQQTNQEAAPVEERKDRNSYN
jgi:mannose/fructose/N-acetylgalactosamine-specific phosphotransferase system component IIC